MKKNILLMALLSMFLISTTVWAGDLTIPNTFTGGTPAVADEVNANFEAVETEVDDNAADISAHVGDGTIHMSIAEIISTLVNAGAIFFGGDGSAGDVTIDADTNWISDPPLNPNFANFTNNAILTVPAGTTIRCAGSFVNNGTIIVNSSYGGTSSNWYFSGGADGVASVGYSTCAHPGDSRRPAFSGGFDNFSANEPEILVGGYGGVGIYQATVITSFDSLRFGGGSGAGWSGGRGGGLLKVYSKGDIVNTNDITADGNSAATACGGGAGGIVILASMTSVDNTNGTIYANGGNGGSSTTYGGPGGGGGGGIVVFISPNITIGTIEVTGGLGGDNSSSVTSDGRTAGGGGGACGGDGGSGGGVPGSTTAAPYAAGDGGDGYYIEITANPAYMIH